MDGSKFDQLIKSITTTRVTRLAALRGLAVGALAAAIGVAAPDDAVAGKKKKCDQCKHRKCKTHNGHKKCRCKDKANGTFCSIAGASSATCVNGSCVAGATPTPTPTTPPPPPGPN